MNGTPASSKVLVVDELRANLTVFSKVLGGIHETEPVCFVSSRDALQWASVNECVLIIIDGNMSEVSGVDFISEVRGKGNTHTPIVIITAPGDKDIQREALKRGASAFLGKPVDPIAFVSLARNLIQLRGARLETMAKVGAAYADHKSATEALAAQERAMLEALVRIIDLRDPRNGDHCRRVALFAEAIGKELGLSFNEMQLLPQAARVHDIGKLAVPDRILNKPARLLRAEREIVQRHVADGVEMLAGLTTPVLQAAAEIANTHHERFDGTGYPAKLQGTSIPLFGRIVAVADTFSALTSRRPWREAVAVKLVVAGIAKEAGTAFDPEVVGAFREIMPEILDIRTEVPDLAEAR